MTTNVAPARFFVHANARLLERHRLAVLLDEAPVSRVVEALAAYHNPDGGFGHALEPDVRCPESQPAATLQALEVLAEVDALDHPMVSAAADWVAGIAGPDGGVPTVLPSAAAHPRAPWMEPSPESGFLTFALAARLWQGGSSHPWLQVATEWCWAALETQGEVGGYTVTFAADFLDAVPDPRRAAEALGRLRPALGADGSLVVEGGTEDERIRPLDISPRPGSPSRVLFGRDQIEGDLDRLQRGQLEDGGWDVDYLHWSPGQAVEWRGIATVAALRTLAAHDRVELGGAPA